MTEAKQPEALRLADLLLKLQTHMGPRRPSHSDDALCWDGYTQAAAELRRLHARIAEFEAARIAYASEFESNADGYPDVGNIHANIRTLKAQLSAIGAGGVEPLRPRQCLHQISEPSGWMPIETAPKDGTTVLVYPPSWNGRACSMASYNKDSYARKPRPYWEREDCLGRVSLSREKPPTRWMPLPLPPSHSSADEGWSNG